MKDEKVDRKDINAVILTVKEIKMTLVWLDKVDINIFDKESGPLSFNESKVTNRLDELRYTFKLALGKETDKDIEKKRKKDRKNHKNINIENIKNKKGGIMRGFFNRNKKKSEEENVYESDKDILNENIDFSLSQMCSLLKANVKNLIYDITDGNTVSGNENAVDSAIKILQKRKNSSFEIMEKIFIDIEKVENREQLTEETKKLIAKMKIDEEFEIMKIQNFVKDKSKDKEEINKTMKLSMKMYKLCKIIIEMKKLKVFLTDTVKDKTGSLHFIVEEINGKIDILSENDDPCRLINQIKEDIIKAKSDIEKANFLINRCKAIINFKEVST